MKVGDYVRTRQGNIFKWDKYMTTTKEECREVDSPHIYINQNDIIKSSPNIIDLIEVGDYVNRSRVEEIEEYNGEKYLYLEEMEYSNANQDYINVYCKQEYIKSIVTKEQFESMEYRIGE